MVVSNATFLACALALLLGSAYVAARWVATWRVT